jgi:hypothetical protein
MSIRPQKLEFWIEKRYNVLLTGKHGVGKSTIVIDAFQKAGLRWAYFSGATMDPFIDFVGVPVKIGEPGHEVIELIRPRHIAEGDIQAIFVDELNRTHKKVRNALMELIQFKTINGKPISSDLRIVWAAVNPEGDEADTGTYDVDRLDPAQRDRFQIQYELPYKPHFPYFSQKYGPEMALAATEYWEGLPEPIKENVSPRRLDYALSVYTEGGDVRDVLPNGANSTKLVQALQNGSVKSQLQKLLVAPPVDMRAFFSVENNYARVIETILKTKKYREIFIKEFPAEKVATLLASRNRVLILKVLEEDLKANKTGSVFVPILENTMKAGQNKGLASISKSLLTTYGILSPPQPKPSVSRVPTTGILSKTILDNYYKPGSMGHGILQALLNHGTLRAKELRAFFEKLATSTVLTDMKNEGLIQKTGTQLADPYEITPLGRKYLQERGEYTLGHYNLKRKNPYTEAVLPWTLPQDQMDTFVKQGGLI